jgi:hypothetical protein
MTLLGGKPTTFKGVRFVFNFALPNFYSTHYGLRHCGAELGKRDFMASSKPAAGSRRHRERATVSTVAQLRLPCVNAIPPARFA